MSNIYKQAARLKLSFDTVRGKVTVADLFDMPLTSKTGFDLDTLAKKINKGLKELGEESFVEKADNTDRIIGELCLNIIKDVIETRQTEAKAKLDDKARADEKKKLLGLLGEKMDEELKGLSREELEKRIAAL